MPVKMKYGGPDLLIYNQTSNCAKGVQKPYRGNVFDACNEENFIDRELSSWYQDNTGNWYVESQGEIQPQVVIATCIVTLARFK